MEVNNVNYFENMPNEILLEILSYLKSIDIISISKVSKLFENISLSKELTRTIDVQLEYNFKTTHMETFITKQPRDSIITCLNINCLYWLDVKVLRNNLPKLQALEELYILDTKLGFLMEDVVVYNKLTKLKKIAITMRGTYIAPEALSNFPKVTHLCLHIFTTFREVECNALELIRQLYTLEILIFAEPSQYRNHWLRSQLIYERLSESLRKMTCHLYNRRILNDNIINIPGMVHYSWKDGYTFEKLEEEKLLEARTFSIRQHWRWRKLDKFFQHYSPFSMSDARKLQLRLKTADDIYFKDLNFVTYSGCTRFKLLCAPVLFSKNTAKLKSLAINYCMKISNVNFLKNLAEHCTNLQELELWHCQNIHETSYDDYLSGIKFLINLRKLTLDNFPVTSAGDCLIEICKSCEQLSSLKISNNQYTPKLVDFVCLSLPHAKNLLQFRFKTEAIPVNRVLRSLPKKLQRVFLKCDYVTSFSEMYLHYFLIEREEIKFMCILIYSLSEYSIKCIKKYIKKMWENSDKIVVVEKFIADKSDIYMKIPSVYIHETVDYTSQVSDLDMFKCDW